MRRGPLAPGGLRKWRRFQRTPVRGKARHDRCARAEIRCRGQWPRTSQGVRQARQGLRMSCTIGRAHYASRATVSKAMKELIQLFTQIALLRRGPQDLPASLLLLAMTIVGYFGINVLASALMPPIKGWAAAHLV